MVIQKYSNPTIPINVLNYNFPFAAGEWERVERYVQYYFLAVLNNEKLCVFASVACELKTNERDGEFMYGIKFWKEFLCWAKNRN